MINEKLKCGNSNTALACTCIKNTYHTFFFAVYFVKANNNLDISHVEQVRLETRQIKFVKHWMSPSNT